jgi:hypothetical protein
MMRKIMGTPWPLARAPEKKSSGKFSDQCVRKGEAACRGPESARKGRVGLQQAFPVEKVRFGFPPGGVQPLSGKALFQAKGQHPPLEIPLSWGEHLLPLEGDFPFLQQGCGPAMERIWILKPNSPLPEKGVG